MSANLKNLDTETSEMLAALERFVVDNDDLLALEAAIGKFNIFDALDVARAEIRHSNFLAFILDPAESHGQGQLFLKAVLMDLLKAAPLGLRPFSPIELDGIDLRGVEVRREWQHIDLLIECQQPAFVVAIENKIGSHEHSDQLPRYKATIQSHYRSFRQLYVYLTPKGDEPSQDVWVPYSYADIFRVLTRARKTFQNAIGDEVHVFLEHYLSLIGTLFMDNKTIDGLCQRIYKNHRRAIDLIIERAGNRASGVLAEAETILRDDPRWHVFSYRLANMIDFVPKAWLEWLPSLGLDRKDEPLSWFILRLQVYPEDGKLDFYVSVRRIADVVKRREVVNLLIREGQKFGFKHSGHKVKDNYTRVSGRERVMKWNADEEPEPEAIRLAVKKKLDEVFPKLEGLPLLLKPLLEVPRNAGNHR